MVKAGRGSAKQTPERKKGEPGEKRGHEVPRGQAYLSEEQETNDVKRLLSHHQTERGGQAFWDAEQADRHLPSWCDTSIASQPLLP
jgi:hypothetical protein